MALYKGKEGRWITTETGRHIFIENGKDPKEVIEELFEWDKEEKFDDEEMDLNVNESVNVRKVTVQKSSSYWGYDHDIRKEFKRAMTKEWYDEDVIKMTNKTMDNSYVLPKGVKLKDTATPSKFKAKFAIIIDICAGESDVSIAEKYFHEMGHASDWEDYGKYKSSSFVSKKYNKTMSDMLKEEFSQISTSNLIYEYEVLDQQKSLLDDKYTKGEITYQELFDNREIIDKIQTDWADVVQGQKGDQFVKEHYGWTPHSPKHGKPYFDQADFLRGTELFAELTCHRAVDKEKRFLNTIRKYCPKTIEIYEEIMEALK